jgi:GcrA cell cycle regulator
MSWTPKKEQELRNLWTKGYSASQISSMLGDTTRNAVIGKAHRLELEARAKSRKHIVKNDIAKNDKPEIKRPKLGRKAKFKALLLDKNFEAENPKKLEELTDETCRWPIGHPYEEKFYFCGRKPIDTLPYCKLHALYAFQPKNAKEEDIITEEDVPQYIEKKNKSA